MRACDLDFDLPPDRIAQHPVSPRDSAKLLVLDRQSGSIEHARFRDLPRWLRRGDCLVLNDTRVLPARFALRRATGGRIGGLFLAEPAPGRWRVLLAGAARLSLGERLTFERGSAGAVVRERGPRGEFEIEVEPPRPAAELLATAGEVPLPPYIRRDAGQARSESLRDRFNYQTVYARHDGSVAAPTAGLHFTPELLEQVAAAGVSVERLTLHVGPGTFQPVEVDDLSAHRLSGETYELSEASAERINAARRAGGRVVAVGTTSTRTLETCAGEAGTLHAARGSADLFIYPPYAFRAIDALVTNFHLPRSTLLALVYAFAGIEPARRAYAEAIAAGYRFYSYGDAMLIV